MDADVAIVGAGIAGAALAHALAPTARVLLLEREAQPGMHSTGRSAAMFMESYGPPQGRALTVHGGGVGLATSGSGDVLAGAIAGLLARGAAPLVAAAWGAWLHARAGRDLGPPGFLARELPGRFPAILAAAAG